MRRMLSISMTVVLGFLLTAPMFADSSSSLPQCCRRSGAHHCSGEMASGTERSLSRIGSQCPLFPKAMAVPAAHEFTVAVARGEETAVFVHPTAAPQTEARYRIAFARSRQKRGPPALTTAC